METQHATFGSLSTQIDRTNAVLLDCRRYCSFSSGAPVILIASDQSMQTCLLTKRDLLPKSVTYLVATLADLQKYRGHGMSIAPVGMNALKTQAGFGAPFPPNRFEPSRKTIFGPMSEGCRLWFARTNVQRVRLAEISMNRSSEARKGALSWLRCLEQCWFS